MIYPKFKMQRAIQMGLFDRPPPRRGGARDGAGRKRLPAGRRRVSHGKRPRLSRHHPVHAVLRVADRVCNLRGPPFLMLLDCFRRGCLRQGFRLVHFSVQSNHIHLLVEADDEVRLANGMQGLAIRIARQLNRITFQTGRVFADHYFAKQLKSPRQVRHALRYVFRNAEHHTSGAIGIDSRSSERLFGGETLPPGAPVTFPETWLLTLGFRRIKGKPWPPPA
jgi:REP element-mobilizing transposase RayT